MMIALVLATPPTTPGSCAFNAHSGSEHKQRGAGDPEDSVREIPLTQGIVALIDDEDFDLVSQFDWYARKHRRTYYATRNNPGPPRHSEQMHRLILGLPRFGPEADHIDGVGYHNWKANLRIVTDEQNSQNKRKPKLDAASMWKGVSRTGPQCTLPWRARISIDKKLIEIGHFASEEAAALAYDAEARLHFREFACVNFARPGERSAV